MAVITPTVVIDNFGVCIVTWAAMAGADTGAPVRMAQYSDKTAQVIGDATTVAIEGSNDGSTFSPLTDTAGAAIALAGATDDVETILQNPLYIRPNVTGGASSTVIVVAKATGK